ncbi:MAG: S8 family serine peptidase [Acidobacteriota bacterium]|nr:MAG: S8 family serine peptidase [Acidobacteriota bacterium]
MMARATQRTLGRAIVLMAAAALALPALSATSRGQRSRSSEGGASLTREQAREQILENIKQRRRDAETARLQAARRAPTHTGVTEQQRRTALERALSRRERVPARVTPGLRRVIDAVGSGTLLAAKSPQASASSFVDGQRVRVSLLVVPAQAADLERRIDEAGGSVLSRRGPVVEAWVPAPAFDALLEEGAVRTAGLARPMRLRRSVPMGLAGEPQAATGAVVTEGVPISGADDWQDYDTRAIGLARQAPVRIAVLDLAFGGYQARVGDGELPSDVSASDFAALWDIEGCQSGETPPCIVDGTALAEIVADMSPEVSLHLVAVDPSDFNSVADAIDYLIAQQIRIAVSGLTWSPGFFGDGFGNGPISTEISRALGAGVTWINDVGDADFLSLLLLDFVPAVSGHWTGSFVDDFDADGYMDVWFSDDDPAIDGWLNEFCLGADDRMFLDLVWDDWVDANSDGVPNSGQNYTIDIWREEAGELFIEVTSFTCCDTGDPFCDPDDFNAQCGDEGDYPWDLLDFANLGTGQACYWLSIFFGEGTPAEDRFHLYWNADSDAAFGTISPDFVPPRSVPEGNRMIPADTPGVVSVGASDLFDDVETFSGRGLADEGAPALCAPARDVSIVTTDPIQGDFFLTSFGAAHVGGAIGLLMQKVKVLDASAALAVLEARARDITGTAPDETCGAGRLCMLTTGCPPSIPNVPPTP